MNRKEQERIFEILRDLSDAEREQVEKERLEIIEWSISEEKKAMEKIKAEGRFRGGLDGKYPELIEISKERNRKYDMLLDKISKAHEV